MLQIMQGNNKFYIGNNANQPLAEITFQPNGEGNLIVDHTFVSDELRGQGVAGKLVEKIISFAREEGVKIIPECSYVQGYLEKNNIHDIRA
jgi:uncharacterized protein